MLGLSSRCVKCAQKFYYRPLDGKLCQRCFGERASSFHSDEAEVALRCIALDHAVRTQSGISTVTFAAAEYLRFLKTGKAEGTGGAK